MLLDKLRIEIYIPCLPSKVYKTLLLKLQEEITYTFGGCTIFEKLDGSYQSDSGDQILDIINILSVDVPNLTFANIKAIGNYCTAVRKNINDELPDEEEIFITVSPVWHP